MSLIYVRCRGRDRSALSKAASGRTQDILAAARAQAAAGRSAEPGTEGGRDSPVRDPVDPASFGCPHRFKVECREVDQVLVCPLCEELSTFVNLGVFECEGCGHSQRVSLLMRPRSGRCDQCGHESPPFLLNTPQSQLKYWPLEHHPSFAGNYVINGCRLSAFRGSEDEIEFAKDALDRAYQAGWYSFRNQSVAPRAMFIRERSVWKGGGDIPCSFRNFHAYCNFPWFPGDEHNAKFSGSLAGFATGWPFQVAVDENDCEDVWVASKLLLDELSRFPRLAKYRSCLKLS